MNPLRRIFELVQGGKSIGYDQHNHTHVFEAGVSRAEQAEWLKNVEETCRAAGVEYVVRKTSKDGALGYEFGFADVTHYAAFTLNTFGDLEGRRQHTHIHSADDPAYLRAFRMAGEAHLRRLGIDYECEQQDGELHFKLDRFSDKLKLMAAIENGTIDHMARSIQSQQHVFSPPQQPFDPRLN